MHRRQLPEPLGGLFEVLDYQVTDTTYAWQTYKTLFRTSELRSKLLQESCPAFFDVVHMALLDRVF